MHINISIDIDHSFYRILSWYNDTLDKSFFSSNFIANLFVCKKLCAVNLAKGSAEIQRKNFFVYRRAEKLDRCGKQKMLSYFACGALHCIGQYGCMPFMGSGALSEKNDRETNRPVSTEN